MVVRSFPFSTFVKFSHIFRNDVLRGKKPLFRWISTEFFSIPELLNKEDFTLLWFLSLNEDFCLIIICVFQTFVMLVRRFVIFLLLAVVCLFDLVEGRGHLIDPPMRSSLWRYYPWGQMGVPKNVDDTGLNCGGYWVINHAVSRDIYRLQFIGFVVSNFNFDSHWNN